MMHFSRSFTAALLGSLMAIASAPAAPSLIITPLGTDMGSSGNKISGPMYDGAVQEYVPYTWERGVGFSRVQGAFVQNSGVWCSDDVTVLSQGAIDTTNWGNVACFAGYYFSAEDAANGHVLGTPRPAPNPCPQISISHRWSAATGWTNTGSFDRLQDPASGRFYGGTRCDFDINSPNDLSGNGRFVIGGAWSAPLTTPSGGPAFGLCGDFFGFAYDSVSGVFSKLPVQSGTTTSRADKVNFDGSVITGYDLGIIEESSPVAVTIGDIDGDSIPDVIAAHEGSANISILRGVGNGNLQPKQNFSPAVGPIKAVAAADLDQDGNLDLAIVGAFEFVLWPGTGAPGFNATIELPVGTAPSAVAIGNFDGDGIPDIAVANQGSGDVSVHIGFGNWSFGLAGEFGADTGPAAITLAHIDSDSNVDIVTANKTAGTASILRGNGDGTFQAPINVGVGANPIAIAAGDLNGDARTDLVAAGSGGSVWVLLQNVSGTFASPVMIPVGVSLSGIALSNINGDGALDVVVSDRGGDNARVLLGNGVGGFSSPVAYIAGSNPSALAVGDLSADGKPDIVVTNYASANVSVLLAGSGGTFNPSVNYASGGGVFNSLRRTCVWRNNVQTILDSSLSSKDNAAVNRAGTMLAQGASPEMVAAAFPGEVGVRLVRWDQQGSLWAPNNLGKPINYPDPDSGVGLTFNNLWVTAISDDGSTIVGTAEYGGGLRRPFIRRPSINGGTPIDLMSYLATIENPSNPIFSNGTFYISFVSNVSADGNALLVVVEDRRNTCPPGFNLPTSLYTAHYGLLYLEGGGIQCEMPRIALQPVDVSQTYDLRIGAVMNIFTSGSWPMTFQWQREDPANPGTWLNLSDDCAGFPASAVNPWAFEGTRTRQLRIGTGNQGANRAGRYRVTISNACGTATSNPATISFRSGACCQTGVECTVTYVDECLGAYLGDGTTCAPQACDPRACCSGAVCQVLDPETCAAAGGTLQGVGVTCSPDPCTPSGLCCVGAVCLSGVAAIDCVGPGKLFISGQTSCNPLGPTPPRNDKLPCCKADYNHSGVITVQDLFDYLSAWFGKVLPADINGAVPSGGASVTVQDLFDYLAAWFAKGCP